MASPLVLLLVLIAGSAAADSVVIHNVVAGPSDPTGSAHCYQLTVPLPNKWWASHGYQYTMPPWAEGKCPAKYNWFNRNETVAPGAMESIYGIHTNESEAVAVQDPPPHEPTFINNAIKTYTHLDSPTGKQHCLELLMPANNKTSRDLFWANYNWKYPSPPWNGGLCDKIKWNYVNRVFKNYNNFEGVTFTEYGIQANASSIE